MDLAHFYHLYSGGVAWRDPLAEHLAALEDSGYDGPLHVGIVGPPDTRAEALHELNNIRPPDSLTEADDGWEQVTLAPLRAYARKHDGAILYAHTKGASDPSPINVIWRRWMSHHLIHGWRACHNALRTGRYDAVGCHWLTSEQFGPMVTTPFFGGTFWMATTEYLSKLPKCAQTSRFDAELWIGLARPRVLDLLPGWPGSYGSMPRYRQIIAGT